MSGERPSIGGSGIDLLQRFRFRLLEHCLLLAVLAVGMAGGYSARYEARSETASKKQEVSTAEKSAMAMQIVLRHGDLGSKAAPGLVRIINEIEVLPASRPPHQAGY